MVEERVASSNGGGVASPTNGNINSSSNSTTTPTNNGGGAVRASPTVMVMSASDSVVVVAPVTPELPPRRLRTNNHNHNNNNHTMPRAKDSRSNSTSAACTASATNRFSFGQRLREAMVSPGGLKRRDSVALLKQPVVSFLVAGRRIARSRSVSKVICKCEHLHKGPSRSSLELSCCCSSGISGSLSGSERLPSDSPSDRNSCASYSTNSRSISSSEKSLFSWSSRSSCSTVSPRTSLCASPRETSPSRGAADSKFSLSPNSRLSPRTSLCASSRETSPFRGTADSKFSLSPNSRLSPRTSPCASPPERSPFRRTPDSKFSSFPNSPISPRASPCVSPPERSSFIASSDSKSSFPPNASFLFSKYSSSQRDSCPPSRPISNTYPLLQLFSSTSDPISSTVVCSTSPAAFPTTVSSSPITSFHTTSSSIPISSSSPTSSFGTASNSFTYSPTVAVSPLAASNPGPPPPSTVEVHPSTVSVLITPPSLVCPSTSSTTTTVPSSSTSSSTTTTTVPFSSSSPSSSSATSYTVSSSSPSSSTVPSSVSSILTASSPYVTDLPESSYSGLNSIGESLLRLLEGYPTDLPEDEKGLRSNADVVKGSQEEEREGETGTAGGVEDRHQRWREGTKEGGGGEEGSVDVTEFGCATEGGVSDGRRDTRSSTSREAHFGQPPYPDWPCCSCAELPSGEGSRFRYQRASPPSETATSPECLSGISRDHGIWNEDEDVGVMIKSKGKDNESSQRRSQRASTGDAKHHVRVSSFIYATLGRPGVRGPRGRASHALRSRTEPPEERTHFDDDPDLLKVAWVWEGQLARVPTLKRRASRRVSVSCRRSTRPRIARRKTNRASSPLQRPSQPCSRGSSSVPVSEEEGCVSPVNTLSPQRTRKRSPVSRDSPALAIEGVPISSEGSSLQQSPGSPESRACTAQVSENKSLTPSSSQPLQSLSKPINTREEPQVGVEISSSQKVQNEPKKKSRSYSDPQVPHMNISYRCPNSEKQNISGLPDVALSSRVTVSSRPGGSCGGQRQNSEGESKNEGTRQNQVDEPRDARVTSGENGRSEADSEKDWEDTTSRISPESSEIIFDPLLMHLATLHREKAENNPTEGVRLRRKNSGNRDRSYFGTASRALKDTWRKSEFWFKRKSFFDAPPSEENTARNSEGTKFNSKTLPRRFRDLSQALIPREKSQDQPLSDQSQVSDVALWLRLSREVAPTLRRTLVKDSALLEPRRNSMSPASSFRSKKSNKWNQKYKNAFRLRKRASITQCSEWEALNGCLTSATPVPDSPIHSPPTPPSSPSTPDITITLSPPPQESTPTPDVALTIPSHNEAVAARESSASPRPTSNLLQQGTLLRFLGKLRRRQTTLAADLPEAVSSRSSVSGGSEDGQSNSHSSDYEDQDDIERTGSASLVGRMRGLRRDMQKKISRLKSPRGSTSSSPGHVAAGGGLPSAGGDEKGTPPHLSTSPVDALPSAGQLGQTASGSNRSSLSGGEEAETYTGPFIGRARALVDYQPSPYDRDAIKFKKGDVIDIIAKNPSGLWKGCVGGRVGHFKFILVEEEIEQQRAPRRSRVSSSRGTTRRGRSRTLEELLARLRLSHLVQVFVLNGYEDLEQFREVEAEDLDCLGITDPETRAKLLTAVALLHDADSDPEDLQSSHHGESGGAIHRGDHGRDSGCYTDHRSAPAPPPPAPSLGMGDENNLDTRQSTPSTDTSSGYHSRGAYNIPMGEGGGGGSSTLPRDDGEGLQDSSPPPPPPAPSGSVEPNSGAGSSAPSTPRSYRAQLATVLPASPRPSRYEQQQVDYEAKYVATRSVFERDIVSREVPVSVRSPRRTVNPSLAPSSPPTPSP